jgi:hypothetical protein
MAGSIDLETAGELMTYGGTPAPERTPAVTVAALLVGLVGLISVARVAYGVIVNLRQDDWDSGARAVFLVLNSIILIVALFILLLASQVWRGRLWAWITSLVVLPFTILFGGLLLLITAVGGDIPFAGIGVVAASIAGILGLTVPRSVRRYFLRRPAPVPTVPAYPWGPGYPPA